MQKLSETVSRIETDYHCDLCSLYLLIPQLSGKKTRLSHKTGITITRLKVLGVLHKFLGDSKKKRLSKLKNPRS